MIPARGSVAKEKAREANATEAPTPSVPYPKPGRYRHYKGPEYIVIGCARHSETEEWLVVYRPDYGDRGLWVRPLSMFMEMVEVNGKSVPRFSEVLPGCAD